MKLSVVISTYNRSNDLKLTLDCLKRQAMAEGDDYEVVLIDNNSNDDTKAVVEAFMPSFNGRLKYLFEPRQGKTFALNIGIKEAKGDVIVLTDDDCTFDDDYLAKICEVFKNRGSTVDFIGGKCLPRWVDCRKPEWFKELKPGWWSKSFFWGPLAILDYGAEPFFLEGEDKRGLFFYGANMAVRREFFVKYGHEFANPPVEDVEFQQHLLKENMRGLYTPHIPVYHKIAPERVTPQHYFRWYYLRGTLLNIRRKYRKKFYHPFGVQWAFIAETVKLWLMSVFARCMTGKIYHRCHALFNLGQMKQIRQQNHNGGK